MHAGGLTEQSWREGLAELSTLLARSHAQWKIVIGAWLATCSSDPQVCHAGSVLVNCQLQTVQAPLQQPGSSFCLKPVFVRLCGLSLVVCGDHLLVMAFVCGGGAFHLNNCRLQHVQPLAGSAFDACACWGGRAPPAAVQRAPQQHAGAAGAAGARHGGAAHPIFW